MPLKPRTRFSTFGKIALILLAASWVFWPAIHGRLLWDDPLEITGNPELRSLHGLGKIWISPADPDYYPLKTTVEWLEWHLWGDRVEGYHLVSVALHIMGALILWRLLGKLNVSRAWLGGLIFAVHPLAVESVAWISELKNVLSLPLLLLAMIWYVDFDSDSRNDSGSRNRKILALPGQNLTISATFTPCYILSLLCFLAAMLAKSSVVMFPVVLLLYAWCKRGRIGRRDLAAAAPFFAVSLALGAAAWWFQAHRAMGTDIMRMPGFATRAADAGPAVWFYLFKSVIPFHPLPIYPHWHFGARSPVCWLAWAALAAALVWMGSKRSGWRRHAFFGVGFFLVNLVPVLGFVPMYYLHIAQVGDQFVYLPLAGLAGLGAAAIGTRLRGAALFLLLAAFAVQSRVYAGMFQSEKSLWTYTVRLNPGAWLAQSNLAGTLFLENRFDEARLHYEQALRIRPKYPEADIGMGNCLEQTRQYDLAIPWYREALRILPHSPAAHGDLGYALERLGRLQEAIAQFNLAIAAKPGFPVAFYNLGNTFSLAGRFQDAIGAYQKALQLQPGFPEARHNLGIAFAASGRLDEAIAQYKEALRLRPDFPEAHNDLGLVLVRAGRLSEAIAHYREALRLKPDFSAARYNLGLALRAAGRNREAFEQFNQALP